MRFKTGDVVQIRRNLYNKKGLLNEIGVENFNKNLVVLENKLKKEFRCFGLENCKSVNYYECETLDEEMKNIQLCECEIQHNIKEKIDKIIKYG